MSRLWIQRVSAWTSPFPLISCNKIFFDLACGQLHLSSFWKQAVSVITFMKSPARAAHQHLRCLQVEFEIVRTAIIVRVWPRSTMKEPLTSWAPSASSSCGDSSGCSCDSPGCCYDPTIVPDTQVFHAPKHLGIAPPSTVETSRGEDGIYSHDPTLDYDTEELWRFLTSNLNPPRVAIHLHATHSETRIRMVTSTVAGDTTSRLQEYTETVTDFDFHVDVSSYVIPQWCQIVAQPSRAGSGTVTVRETLEEYTSSKSAFKEFRLEKHVTWDYGRVSCLLTDLSRSSLGHGCHDGVGKLLTNLRNAMGRGHHVRVSVEFPKHDWKVSALASNRYSRAAHSTLVHVLCVLTCLWIVFLPAWAIARKRMKNRLTCEYHMAVSADEFYSRNWFQIHSAVLRRCRGEYLVGL